MINEILQVVLVFALFIVTTYFTYKLTEEWGLPKWLDYKPFICNKCFTFWSLLAIYLSIGLIFKLYITLIVGLILSVANAIAMHINEKKRTVKVEMPSPKIYYDDDGERKEIKQIKIANRIYSLLGEDGNIIIKQTKIDE